MLETLQKLARYINTAGGGVREGVGDAGTVADDVQSLMAGLQIAVDFDFHIVKFYFDTVKKSVVVGGTWSDFIQSVNHFDDAVQDTLGHN